MWINIVLGDAADLPFGGVKRSGSGRDMGRYAMRHWSIRSPSGSLNVLVAPIYRAPRGTLRVMWRRSVIAVWRIELVASVLNPIGCEAAICVAKHMPPPGTDEHRQ